MGQTKKHTMLSTLPAHLLRVTGIQYGPDAAQEILSWMRKGGYFVSGFDYANALYIYSRDRDWKGALQFFHTMQNDFIPDEHVLLALMRVLESCDKLDHMYQVFKLCSTFRVYPTPTMYTFVVQQLIQHKRVDLLMQAVEDLDKPDVPLETDNAFANILKLLSREKDPTVFLKVFDIAIKKCSLPKKWILLALKFKKITGDRFGFRNIQKFIKKSGATFRPSDTEYLGPWIGDPDNYNTIVNEARDTAYENRREVSESSEDDFQTTIFRTFITTPETDQKVERSESAAASSESSYDESDFLGMTDFLQKNKPTVESSNVSMQIPLDQKIAEQITKPRADIETVWEEIFSGDYKGQTEKLAEISRKVLRRVRGEAGGEILMRSLRHFEKIGFIDHRVFNLALFYAAKSERWSAGLEIINWMHTHSIPLTNVPSAMRIVDLSKSEVQDTSALQRIKDLQSNYDKSINNDPSSYITTKLLEIGHETAKDAIISIWSQNLKDSNKESTILNVIKGIKHKNEGIPLMLSIEYLRSINILRADALVLALYYLAKADRLEVALSTVNYMHSKSIAISPSIYDSLLASAKRTQSWQLAQGIISSMRRAQVAPTSSMLIAMRDIHVAAKQYHKALAVLQKMKAMGMRLPKVRVSQ